MELISYKFLKVCLLHSTEPRPIVIIGYFLLFLTSIAHQLAQLLVFEGTRLAVDHSVEFLEFTIDYHFVLGQTVLLGMTAAAASFN